MKYNHSETERIFNELGYAITKHNFNLVANFMNVHPTEVTRGAIYWLSDKLSKKEMGIELTTEQKLQLRCKSLDMAQNTAFNNTETLLSIADKIYEWLVKDL